MAAQIKASYVIKESRNSKVGIVKIHLSLYRKVQAKIRRGKILGAVPNKPVSNSKSFRLSSAIVVGGLFLFLLSCSSSEKNVQSEELNTPSLVSAPGSSLQAHSEQDNAIANHPSVSPAKNTEVEQADGQVKIWSEKLKGKLQTPRRLQKPGETKDYPVQIYLPEIYDSKLDGNLESNIENNIESQFPILYVLDAQWNFQIFVEAIDRLSYPVIVVGIAAGEPLEQRRREDFHLPGAQQYLKVLVEYLVPELERDLRVDTSQRSIQGTSASGVAVLALALAQGSYESFFANIISYDPSVQKDVEALLNLVKARQLSSDVKIKSSVYIATASAFGNYKNVERFLKALKTRLNFQPVHTQDYAVPHAHIASEAHLDTLRLLYENKPKQAD